MQVCILEGCCNWWARSTRRTFAFLLIRQNKLKKLFPENFRSDVLNISVSCSNTAFLIYCKRRLWKCSHPRTSHERPWIISKAKQISNKIPRRSSDHESMVIRHSTCSWSNERLSHNGRLDSFRTRCQVTHYKRVMKNSSCYWPMVPSATPIKETPRGGFQGKTENSWLSHGC